MIYVFDLDNTICNTCGSDYDSCVPKKEMVDKVNHLYESGNHIIVYTARGMSRFGGDENKAISTFYNLTKDQLKSWGVKHHELKLGKLSYDFWIDDKNLTISEFQKNILPKNGFIAGSFDLIHPGYVEMFEFIKKNCEYLIVGLHSDPSLDRPTKIKPILSIQDRKKLLLSLRYVDEVIEYETESQLENILKSGRINIRFLGNDYINKSYTGKNIKLETIFINRDHGWSTTKLKNEIAKCVK
jgi:glycerol-3-phosphate cytidylyltransferase